MKLRHWFKPQTPSKRENESLFLPEKVVRPLTSYWLACFETTSHYTVPASLGLTM